MHDMSDEGPASPISAVKGMVGTSAALLLVDTIAPKLVGRGLEKHTSSAMVGANSS